MIITYPTSRRFNMVAGLCSLGIPCFKGSAKAAQEGKDTVTTSQCTSCRKDQVRYCKPHGAGTKCVDQAMGIVKHATAA
jgi:hypothetical protein